MPDERARKPGDGLSDEADEIEIVEVVGMDTEDPPPSPEEDGVELVFDEEPWEDSAVGNGSSEPAEEKAVEEDQRERLLRLQADFENLRKRVERERDDYYRHATAVLVSRLLPVVDNLERALQRSAVAGEESRLREGLELIYRQLMDELKKEGLQPVESLGGAFDPSRHEAVATDAQADAAPNTVVEEFQKGYFFRNRLLRPALVKVSVDASGESVEDDGEES